MSVMLFTIKLTLVTIKLQNNEYYDEHLKDSED